MIAWFICPYKRRPVPRPIRYCAIDDFTAQIRADGGDWSASEVLGNSAVVKVRASQATLDLIAATFQRIPLSRLADSLSTLTSAQRTAIRDRLLALGYPDAEIRAALGSNLANRTLGDVLRFAATRRLKPRYDALTDQIFVDGPQQPCRPIADVDTAVVTG